MKTIDRLWGHLLALCIATAFIGFVAGAALNDEQFRLREWISALSGWFAGGTAIWLGLTQLRPLIFDMKLKQHTFTTERAKLWYDAYSKINKAGTKAIISMFPFTTPDPISEILRGSFENGVQASSAAHEKAMDICDNFEKYINCVPAFRHDRETPKKYIEALQVVIKRKTDITEGILDIFDEVSDRMDAFEGGTFTTDEYKELFRSSAAMQSTKKIDVLLEQFEYAHGVFLDELAREVTRQISLISQVDD